MQLGEVLKALLLGVFYAGLWLFLMFTRTPLELPGWWYATLGESSFSAILWMQIEHSVNLLIAAVPVAIAIAYLFSNRWKTATLIVALVPTTVIVYDIVTGIVVVMGTESLGTISGSHAISSSIDFIKVWAILFGLVYIVRRVWPTNKSSKRGVVTGENS